MEITEWNLEHITLVSVTLYFILSLLALATFIISRQVYIIRKSAAYYVRGITEGKEKNTSLFTTTAVRLLTCWLFAFSAAFLAFSRLQCGSHTSVPPYWCSVALQFFFAGEMQFLTSEQIYNRLCLFRSSKKGKYVVLKFLIFSVGIPASLVCGLHFVIGRETVSSTFDASKECDTVFTTPSTAARPIVSPPIVSPLYVERMPEGIYGEYDIQSADAAEEHPPAGRNMVENCWISWMSTSVRVTSAFAVSLLLVGVGITWMNVVTLLRRERHGKRVGYGYWWGVAARIVVMVITIAKWASVAFQSTCSSNLYNIYAVVIVMPILLAVMFCGTGHSEKSCQITTIKARKLSEAESFAHDVIELTNINENSVMLHHDIVNEDVTHVTHEKELFAPQKFFDGGKERSAMGDNHWTSYNGGQRTFPKQLRDRHSTDVDDGVISSDGDYDAPRPNHDAVDVEAGVTSPLEVRYDVNENKSDPKRLSHAESTDSGMGFSDNPKDCDNSRLSDAMAGLSESDNYGTIKPPISPPQEAAAENRESLIDGDADYDEVTDFIFKPGDDGVEKGSDSRDAPEAQKDSSASANPQTPSKYAELDLAKILHTRRRHKSILTATRKEPEEEKPQEIGLFDSLRRKSKSKNLPFGNYATYGRNRKTSRQYSNDTWTLRPSSTCNDNEDPLTPLSDKDRYTHFNSLNHKSNYTLVDLPLHESQVSTFNSRTDFNNDLMMTSDIQEEAVAPLRDIEKRNSWRTGAKSPPVVEDTTPTNELGHNRWSWISNSSQTQSQASEKHHQTPKSPWTTFRRLFGFGSSDSKDESTHKPTRSASTMSAVNLSSRPRSTSIFRRFSTKKTNKNKPLNSRRNSVPTKSEWDVHRPVGDDIDLDVGPLRSAVVSHPRLTAPKPAPVKPKGRFGSRLMSFRSNKSRAAKYSKEQSGTMSNSKGLSISSPQLSIHAVDPTRNYSEHQLLNLNRSNGAQR